MEPATSPCRLTPMTPLVPASCVALAVLLGGCTATPAQAAAAHSTPALPTTAPTSRPIPTATARRTRVTEATRLEPDLTVLPGPCPQQSDDAAGVPGVPVDRVPAGAAPVARGRHPTASGGTDTPLAGRQAGPSPIHPLPNYAPPRAGPPVPSSPQTTPQPRIPVTGCIENIHIGPTRNANPPAPAN